MDKQIKQQIENNNFLVELIKIAGQHHKHVKLILRPSVPISSYLTIILSVDTTG